MVIVYAFKRVHIAALTDVVVLHVGAISLYDEGSDKAGGFRLRAGGPCQHTRVGSRVPRGKVSYGRKSGVSKRHVCGVLHSDRDIVHACIIIIVHAITMIAVTNDSRRTDLFSHVQELVG